MATTFTPKPQPRDWNLLWGLYLTPMTIKQGILWSQSGPADFRFTTERKLLERLEEFRQEHVCWVSRWRYGNEGAGSSPYYYKITLEGYREFMNDMKAEPGGKYSFGRVSRNEELHAQGLADFIITLHRAAHRFDFSITECQPDKTVSLENLDLLEDDSEEDEDKKKEEKDGLHYPDFVFSLTAPNRQKFRFYVEYDRRTLSIRSTINRDALEWKMRRYEAHHYRVARDDRNFRVLFPTVDSQQHVENIIKVAQEVVLEPRREIFYACQASDFANASNPLFQRIWLSQKGNTAALIPKYHKEARTPRGSLDRSLALK